MCESLSYSIRTLFWYADTSRSNGCLTFKSQVELIEIKYLTIEKDNEVFARVIKSGLLGTKNAIWSNLLSFDSFSWTELSSKLIKWSNHVDDPTWKY